jgi:hypothetical protein
MRVVVLVAAIALVVAVPPPAVAGGGAGERQLVVGGRSRSPVRQQAGGGQLGPDYVRATAADFGAGTYGGGAPLPAMEPSVRPVYEWLRVPTGGDCVFVTGPLPPDVAGFVGPLPGYVGLPDQPARIAPIVDAPPGAVRYDGPDPLPEGLVDIGDTASDIGLPLGWDRDIVVVPRCVRPGTALPPTPPTAADIWQQTPLPRARIRANPPGTRQWPGVVHLQSRFWADPLPHAVASVALPGFAVDVRAVPVAYAWVPGDGTSAVRAGPGGPADFVAADYPRRGDYPVTLYVVWLGVAHLWMPELGLDLGAQWLGTVTLPARVTHRVADVRARLHS